MNSQTIDEKAAEAIPQMAEDDDEALADASKTFFVTLISAALFCLSAVFILLRTRMGG